MQCPSGVAGFWNLPHLHFSLSLSLATPLPQGVANLRGKKVLLRSSNTLRIGAGGDHIGYMICLPLRWKDMGGIVWFAQRFIPFGANIFRTEVISDLSLVQNRVDEKTTPALAAVEVYHDHDLRTIFGDQIWVPNLVDVFTYYHFLLNLSNTIPKVTTWWLTGLPWKRKVFLRGTEYERLRFLQRGFLITRRWYGCAAMGLVRWANPRIKTTRLERELLLLLYMHEIRL